MGQTGFNLCSPAGGGSIAAPKDRSGASPGVAVQVDAFESAANFETKMSHFKFEGC
jgi:hypothetical protein